MDLYGQAGGSPFDDRFIELANVAMLVWSAGIDLISVHMLLDGELGLGTSVSRRRFLTNRMVPANRHLQLRIGWHALARLHNFQHNLDQSEAGFAASCRDSTLLFAGLNGLLPTALRLQSGAYGWLDDVG